MKQKAYVFPIGGGWAVCVYNEHNVGSYIDVRSNKEVFCENWGFGCEHIVHKTKRQAIGNLKRSFKVVEGWLKGREEEQSVLVVRR